MAARVLGYRRARRYGLHLLPVGLGLCGLTVDVGANRGDFTATIRQLEPRSRVLCIEPVPGNASHLRQRFSSDAGVTISEVAASDHHGAATLNITDVTEFASLHEPGEGLSAYGAAASVVDQVSVPTATLDALVDDEVLILKIDVQGHETAVLRGAAQTLRRTSVVLLEVMFTSQYEGDATFSELDSMMCSAGFCLAGLAAPSASTGPLLWSDACYIRRPA